MRRTKLIEEGQPVSEATGMIGVDVIIRQIQTLPQSPGVYRMLGKAGEALYVGKAKNLKKRVVAYTRLDRLPGRLRKMVTETATMEVVTTHTEVEALLLEIQPDQEAGPRYNILLRDDKSFPYILITGEHEWPQIVKHRGARNRKGEYFGPFASAGAVNQTLSQLQRAFLLRSCADSVFADAGPDPACSIRSSAAARPASSASSRMTMISWSIRRAIFSSGHSHDVQRRLAAQMEQASAALEYEEAAVYRDRIRALSRDSGAPGHQSAPTSTRPMSSPCTRPAASACIQVFFFRSGCNFGNRAFFPAQTQDGAPEEILSAFLGQFYADKTPPREILLSHPLAEEEVALMTEALAERAGRAIVLATPQPRRSQETGRACLRQCPRGARAGGMAESTRAAQAAREARRAFGLDRIPERIEVYDNSHIQGTTPSAA